MEIFEVHKRLVSAVPDLKGTMIYIFIINFQMTLQVINLQRIVSPEVAAPVGLNVRSLFHRQTPRLPV